MFGGGQEAADIIIQAFEFRIWAVLSVIVPVLGGEGLAQEAAPDYHSVPKICGGSETRAGFGSSGSIHRVPPWKT